MKQTISEGWVVDCSMAVGSYLQRFALWLDRPGTLKPPPMDGLTECEQAEVHEHIQQHLQSLEGTTTGEDETGP